LQSFSGIFKTLLDFFTSKNSLKSNNILLPNYWTMQNFCWSNTLLAIPQQYTRHFSSASNTKWFMGHPTPSTTTEELLSGWPDGSNFLQ
jgi:hypothetical protein